MLLILAGVSISALTGDNGIINQSKEAKEQTEIAEEREKVEISAVQAAQLDKYGYITEENLKKQLDKNIGGGKYKLSVEREKFKVTYVNSQRSYFVDKDGNISNVSGDKNIEIQDLDYGWTLGNSLDCYTGKDGLSVEEYETLWNNPITTKEMIVQLKSIGFKTILIPVTWFNHVNEQNEIDEEWLNRVTEIVDYAIDIDMNVIINTHHDDKRLKLESGEEEFTEIIEKYNKIWQQIANNFKDYKYNLLFEILNEPRAVVDGEDIWTVTNQRYYENLNKLSSELLKTIRKTGGNNIERYVILPTYGTLITKEVLNNIEIPDDSHIALSVHGYLPHDFCSEADVVYTDAITEKIRYQINLISEFSKSNNIPVIITEMACVEKVDRINWLADMCFYASTSDIPIIWWDNGSNYRIYNRENLTLTSQEIFDIIDEFYSNDIDNGKNYIEAINYTENVEYNGENMGVRKEDGKNIYFIDMNLSESVRFKFSDSYELSNNQFYQFSCKIKTDMDLLNVKYVLNFYDESGSLIHSENYSDLTKTIVDGSKEEYECKKLIKVPNAYKVQLERIHISYNDNESKDISFEIYDIALKSIR